jgi:hypothetical protein
MEDLIGYDEIVENSMRLVIYEVLKKVANNGLPGKHYFLLGFLTKFPGVKISPCLLEQYPKEILIHVWNDKIEQLARCQVNDFIIARINISSKKNQERYYTEVTAWKIEIDFTTMKKEVTNEN